MTITWVHILGVAAGGAMGGVARYWVTLAVTRRLGERFPWGTLVVNVSGAATIGILAAILREAEAASASWMVLVAGIVGSYTTVSSFSLQTLAMWEGRERRRASLNVAGSLVLCLGAVAAGYAMTRLVSGG